MRLLVFIFRERETVRESVPIPHISLATDGEINFFWNLVNFRLDLGFFGDGTYSYYGENNNLWRKQQWR